jgi:hypothetical protein
MMNGKEALISNASAPLVIAPSDLPTLREAKQTSSTNKRLVLIHPAQQLPQQPQVTKLEGWNVKDIHVEELFVKGFNVASQSALPAAEQSPKEAFRLTISSSAVQGTAEVTHQVCYSITLAAEYLILCSTVEPATRRHLIRAKHVSSE